MGLDRRAAPALGAAVLVAATAAWVGARSTTLGLGVLVVVPVMAVLTAAGLRRPVLAVAAFALLLPAGSIGLPLATNVAQILAVWTSAVVLVARIGGRGRRIGRSAVLAASTLLVVSAFLSTLTSVDLRNSLLQTTNYAAGLALAASVVVATVHRRDLLVLAMAVVLGGAVLSGSVLVDVPDLQARFGSTLVSNRPTGIFAQPNELGLCTAMMLCFGLAMAVVMLRRKRAALCAVCGVASALALMALLLSLSRGGWIGALAGLAVLVALLPGARGPLLMSFLVTGAVVMALLLAESATSNSSVIAERFSTIFTGERSPFDERPAAWAGAFQQMAHSPFLGSGPAAFPAAAAHGLAQFTDVRQVVHAHILYLTVGAEQGVLGIAALAVAIGVGAREALRNRRAAATLANGSRAAARWAALPAEAGVSAAAAAALTAVIAEGAVDYPLRNPVLGAMTWLFIGLLAACARTRSATTDSDNAKVAEMKRLTESLAAGFPARSEKDGPAGKRPRSVPPMGRAILAGLLAGVVVLGVGLIVITAQPTRYAATSTVSFAPRSQPNISADIVRLAATKYAVVAGATTTLDQAARRSSIAISDLRGNLSVAVQQETANVNVTVTSAHADQSARAANSIAAAVARASDNDKLISGEVTAPADPAAAEHKPSRTLLLTVAVVAALLVGVWVGIVVRYSSRRAAREKTDGF
ncbi:O-antigen ligase family protein [Streptomyces canus]|uniref:O-antigen ligase family protein n=1 Tax=Streptomyces canus TaxID=58343 RepID=UPI00048B6C99|nr:O-antigen ligase family protein [Streptomyces canus]